MVAVPGRSSRKRAAGIVFLAGALAAGAPLACDEKPLPGTLLGTYAVVGQPQTNTCGLASPNPWKFNVELSEDGQILYWSWMDGTPPVSTALSAGTQGTIMASQVENVDATDAGPGPCNMERDDSIAITLAAGSPPPTFSGTVTYQFAVSAGANCADQLGSAGGQYATLPCSVSYTITATRQ